MEEKKQAMLDRITYNPRILGGKPIIKGTRISVEFIIDLLAQGWTEDDLLYNYPGLTRADVRACLSYASESCAPGRSTLSR